jgi:haloalkane dehalogenase
VNPPALPRWIEDMLPPGGRRSLIDTGDGRMHVMEWGQGRPVLMLHGNPSWGFLYRKVVAELAGEPLRIVVPDLVGLGLSDKPRRADAHTIPAHGARVAALIDALDLRDLVFVGQDWGGPIGLHALHQRPGRLAGMVVLNTVLGPPKVGFKPTAFHRFANMPVVSELAFRALGLPERTMRLVQGDRASIRGRVSRAYVWPLRRLRDRTAPLALARMVPDSQQHWSIAPLRECEAVVTGFRGPAAIVWGDRDPVLGRVRTRCEALLPQAVVTRTKAGHFLQEEVPAEIADAVRGVARRISLEVS